MHLHSQIAAGILFTAISLIASSASSQETAESPTTEEIQQRIHSLPKSHPRLFADADDFAKLRETLAGSSSTKKALSEHVIRHADLLQDVPPVTRTLEGKRLLRQSRRLLERIINLSMAYQLTGESKYAQRAKKEMLEVANFSDWNPDHFLDVAEIALAMAIGYDWLFDELDDDSRGKIRDAIVTKGLNLPFDSKYDYWVQSEGNWGQVCHAGMTAAALAIMEHEPELAAKTVENAVVNVRHSMRAFAPNGSYPEGPSYWAYGTGFNVLLIDALESVFDDDFGLADEPGFDSTGQYLALMEGPTGKTFNYSDNSPIRRAESVLYWFAKRYDRPDWRLNEDQRVMEDTEILNATNAGLGSNRLLPLALLWMTGDAEPDTVKMPLHWQSESHTSVSIHRSSWKDPNATFIGLKAGSPSDSHGQMDAGSFVFEADGVRWAIDLGAESYHGVESKGMKLFDYKQHSDRWTVFRLQNHAHNTLVIDGELQVAKGLAKIVSFSDKSDRPHSIVDLSEVYQGQATSVKRGVALLSSGEVIMQDQLTGLNPGAVVRWAMVTRANTEIIDNRKVRLEQDGEHLLLNIAGTADSASWSIVDIEKPRNEWDSANQGERMVVFEAKTPESGELLLVVRATPGSCKKSVEKQNVLPLEQW